MIGENNCSGGIHKLEHDILEKLDADGQADWTSEPVLVDEIKVAKTTEGMPFRPLALPKMLSMRPIFVGS